MPTEPYIKITGANSSSLVEAVQQLANLYAELLFTHSIVINQSVNETDHFQIKFTNTPDFERFKYFVNYLHGPDVKDYNATTRGYWTISENDELPSKHLHKRVMLFVPETDTEGDNVYAVFQDDPNTYKFDFAMVHKYQESKDVSLEFEEELFDSFEFKVLTKIDPDTDAIRSQNDLGDGCFLQLYLLIALVMWTFL